MWSNIFDDNSPLFWNLINLETVWPLGNPALALYTHVFDYLTDPYTAVPPKNLISHSLIFKVSLAPYKPLVSVELLS